jgi:hypothetical protein
MAIVTSYDWETQTYTQHMPSVDGEDTLAGWQAWMDAVKEAVERARTALPTHDQRITRGLQLILDGHVEPQEDGSFKVRSQQAKTSKTYHVNGKCECPDAARCSDGLCKHMLSVLIWRKAKRLLRESAPTETPTGADTAEDLDNTVPTPPEVDTRYTQGIPEVLRSYLTYLHGKPFVRYAGLLALAHERGLVQLSARIEFHSEALVLASATATFADGRSYSEWSDAMPGNVGTMVRPHWIRMALTRAKARALRDALQIGIAALEELSDTE